MYAFEMILGVKRTEHEWVVRLVVVVEDRPVRRGDS